MQSRVFFRPAWSCSSTSRRRSAPRATLLETFTWTDEQVRSLQAAQNADRILATVLFTDIVESTAKAAEVGDRAWRQLMDRHLQMAQSEVRRWMGQHIESTGDGIMATFDTPTRALRCAFALHDIVHWAGPGDARRHPHR